MTANGLTLTAGDDVQAGRRRARSAPGSAPTNAEGALDLAILPDAVNPALPQIFSDVSAEPKDAVVRPRRTARRWSSRRSRASSAAGPPAPTSSGRRSTAATGTAALEVTGHRARDHDRGRPGASASRSPVGGSNAWRNGGPTTAGPGFTTYHDCCAATGDQHPPHGRHRRAARSSCRARRSRSTTSSARARRRRGSSRPAPSARASTSTRSAAACRSSPRRRSTPPTSPGSTSPSTRPTASTSRAIPSAARPRWATRTPTCSSRNNTPYGILIWTSYTDTSLTVTLYSTPHATGEQTRHQRVDERRSAGPSRPRAPAPGPTGRPRTTRSGRRTAPGRTWAATANRSTRP